MYKNRFEVVAKLGWGHFSTVWKCRDRSSGEIVALKVQKSARHYTEAALDEIELLKCTVDAATTAASLETLKVVRLIDSFTHVGPNGSRTWLCGFCRHTGVSMWTDADPLTTHTFAGGA